MLNTHSRFDLNGLIRSVYTANSAVSELVALASGHAVMCMHLVLLLIDPCFLE